MGTVDLLKNLIKIPSHVSSNCDETEVATYVKSLFKNSRYEVEEQVVSGKRKNLYIHDKSTPKVVLLAHMDTVPPKKDTIGSSFESRTEGNKLYGLGSGDMKAGLAIAINLMLQNKKPGLALVASVDEEYDCEGARKFVAKYKLKPKLVINPEPTDLQILNGCRGILEFTFEVIGVAAHAGKKHLGVNAIEKSAEIAVQLQEYLKKFDIKDGPRNSVNLARLNGGNLVDYGKNGEPEISGSGNLVPNFAFVHIEIRTAKKEVDLSLIEKFLQSFATKNGVRIEKLRLKTKPVGSMFVPISELKSFETAIKNRNLKSSYLDVNEAGYYEVQLVREAWNCPVVIFGPGPIAMSHKANEYVDLDTVAKTEEVVAQYLQDNL